MSDDGPTRLICQTLYARFDSQGLREQILNLSISESNMKSMVPSASVTGYDNKSWIIFPHVVLLKHGTPYLSHLKA